MHHENFTEPVSVELAATTAYKSPLVQHDIFVDKIALIYYYNPSTKTQFQQYIDPN